MKCVCFEKIKTYNFFCNKLQHIIVAHATIMCYSFYGGSMKDYKIEWSLSLLNKYSTIVLEEKSDLTKTMMLFIIHLKHRPNIHQDQLATMFKMNRSTVTRSVKSLLEKGYVQSCVDEENKKANLLSLSEMGEELYISVMNDLMEWVGIITQGMNKEEIEMSMKLLTKMAGNACNYLGDNQLARILGGK